MSPRGHRLLPHTADLRVEARGEDLPGLYAECITSLFSLLVDRGRVRGKEIRTLRVAGESPEERLFFLLRSAFLLFAVDGFLVRSARATIEENEVVATVSGEPADPSRHSLRREIKAVTRHAMTVEKAPGGFVARYVVDV
jgi:SHS2 domain-containing protein